MNATFKKTFPLFLLLLLFFQVGSLFLFQMLILKTQHEVKEKIIQRIPEEQLVSFDIKSLSNSTTFSWEDEHKEFKYAGKMYDIVRYSKSGNVLCFDDTKETTLFKGFNALFMKYFSESNSGKKIVSHFLSLLFSPFIGNNPISFLKNFFFEKKIFFISYNQKTPSVSIDIEVPPPQIL